MALREFDEKYEKCFIRLVGWRRVCWNKENRCSVCFYPMELKGWFVKKLVLLSGGLGRLMVLNGQREERESKGELLKTY